MFKKNKNISDSTSESQKVNLVGADGVSYSVEKAQPKKPVKHKKLKAVIFIVIVLVIVALLASFISGKREKTSGIAAVSSGVTELQDLETTVSIKGTVVGAESANVYSAENLTITQILVKEGEKVTKGQILAKLDTSKIMDQYNIQSVTYNDAKNAYNVAKALYSEGAISKSEYDAAESAYKTARLTLGSYDTSEKGVIKSPINGTVTRVNCTVGRIANDTNAKEAMFVVEDVSRFKMEVKVSESEIADIKVGQSVEISAEVLGKQKVTGVVSQIAPTGETNVQGNNMVIPVTIDVDKGDTNLIAGVTAKAVIKTNSLKNVLTVPIDAVSEDHDTGETSVFVINKDNTVKKVKVKTGLEGDFDIEIVEGKLKEGNQVVLSPELSLEDGATVVLKAASDK